jgi:hypothetical protein
MEFNFPGTRTTTVRPMCTKAPPESLAWERDAICNGQNKRC